MNKEQNKKITNNKKPETTGHSWDSIEEYNTPAPRWWLIVWIICIIWAIIYWFFYPTWPTIDGNSKGLKNWSSISQLKESQIEINKIKGVYLTKFDKSTFDEIKKDKDLMEFAINGGKSAFQDNCSACHGTGAAGRKGYPNLNDDDWLWGGTVEDIYTTLLYGIRSNHQNTRESTMPSFGLDRILTKKEIDQVSDYVLFLSNQSIKKQEQVFAGKQIFQNNCISCHTNKESENRKFGAPNLTDKIWLYGKNKKDIIHTITYSRSGVMPSWSDRLDDNTIKQLSIYIHSLGGGE